MKLWLDDLRLPPPGWVWVKTSHEAIEKLRANQVEWLSLDHDLGNWETDTGYAVAVFIEQSVFTKEKMKDGQPLKPFKAQIHSANPVGVRNMKVALERVYEFWEKDERVVAVNAEEFVKSQPSISP